MIIGARSCLGRQGSLLIITLWLVTILGVLVVAIARYLSIEVRLTSYRLAREQARVLARSGIHLAMQRLHQDGVDGEGYDWLRDDWAFPDDDLDRPTIWGVELSTEGPTGTGPERTIEIEMIDEERKLALNTLRAEPQDLWTSLSALLESDTQAARLVDYLDDGDEPFGLGGLESDPEAVPPYRGTPRYYKAD